MSNSRAVMNWSGGKDCTMALFHARQAGNYDVTTLLTTVTDKYGRISMHGVRVELVEEQAERLGIPLVKILMPDEPTMDTYNSLMKETLTGLMDHGISISVYGDIFLEDLRQYREDSLQSIGLRGDFPIWKIPSTKLAEDFIDLGFKAVVVCVDERHLDETFAGREFDKSFLQDLPEDVDPCGENGEFHTFVYDGPLFNKPVDFQKGEIVYRTYKLPGDPENKTGFWYCDLVQL